MNERDETLLRDMLDAARAVQSFIVGKNREDLDTELMFAFAVYRGIEVVGEAASRISPETQAQYSQIDWRNVVGMRNRLIHGYAEIDQGIVWNVAMIGLPTLIAQIEAILPPADEET